MACFLIHSRSGSIVASIYQIEGKEELRFLDPLFKQGIDINGITMSQKVEGVWRVFPETNPELFLWAIKNDRGFLRNYKWINQEEYTARQDPNYYKKLAEQIISFYNHRDNITILADQIAML